MQRIFMFSGQGSQYYQMGKNLLDQNIIFKRYIEQVDVWADAF